MNENHLQARYDALEAEKATLNLDNSDDKFRLTIIENDQQQIKDQLSESDRLQRQAEEMADIQLPYDYDARWGVSGANDEIRNLIRQVKEYAFIVHNDELASQAEQNRTKLQAIEQQLEANATTINQLQGINETLTNRATAAEASALRAQDDLKDALQKRDNAVALKEEAEGERDRLKAQNDSLNGQVNELEGMLRTYRSRQNVGGGAVGGLVLTSTLKPETDDERSERVKREKLEQLNSILERRKVAPIPVPPAVTADAPERSEDVPAPALTPATPIDDRFPTNAAADDAVEGQPADGAVVEKTIAEEVEARFRRIEEHLGLKVWRPDEDARQTA